PGVQKSNELYWLSRSYSYPLYQDFRRQNQSFDGLIGIRGASLAIERDGNSRPIWGQAVTANYFQVLGVKTAIGRLLIPAEDESRIPSVVLSYRFWQREFAGDPGIAGKTVKLSGTTYTVVG